MGDAERRQVEMLDDVWRSVRDLCADLDAAQWDAPTECPGWSVHDVVAHLAGVEMMIAGRPRPDVDVSDAPHVRNEFGREMEVWVAALRDRSGPEVLACFDEIARERLSVLAGLDEDGWSAETITPAGPGTVRDLLGFRVFDSWAHEQDIRRAVHRPGGLDTAAARFSLDRARGALGMIVARRAGAPEGATVVFTVTGPTAFEAALEVRDGRGVGLERTPASPTVRVTCDTETFGRLVCGRGDPAGMIVAGDVHIEGDATLGEAVVGSMSITP